MLPAFNYHTHTFRCRHAEGEDREYIEAAIKAGFNVVYSAPSKGTNISIK